MGQIVDNPTNGDFTVDTGTGAVGSVTQRVTIASDDTNLAAIKTAVEILDNVVSGTEAQVDVVSSALPSGAATAANQSTANTALAAIQTAVEILDNAISGTEMQVDIVSGTVTANLSATDNAVLDNIDANTDTFVSSATEATGGVTTSSTTILAASASRKGGYIVNESDTDIWISLGGTATAAVPSTKVRANGGTLSLVIDGKNTYTGAITAIHAGTGTKNVTIVTV